MRRAKKVERYLKDARNAAELSTCLRRQYGAVIVQEGRAIHGDLPLNSGYNGSAVGCDNCCDKGVCWREQNGIPHGEQYEKCQAIHAEENAMYRSNWLDMQGATLYLFGMENGRPIDARPCDICIKRIRTNGISKVICGNADGSQHIIRMD